MTENRKYSATRSLKGSDSFEEYLSSWISFTGTKVSAPFISRLLCGADDGNARDQAALFQTILEKEPVIAAHIQTRICAVLSCAATVDSESPEKSARMETLLRKAGIHGLIKHLMDAVSTGYAGSAIIWKEAGAGIEKFIHINPCNWFFERNGEACLMTDKGPRPLSEYHPNQFVFHTHSLKPGLPARGGLLRTLVWLYFFKHYAMRDRARYIERFGIPFMMARIRRDDFENQNIRDSILNSLAKAGSDGVGVVTEGSNLELLSPSSSNHSDCQTWLEYIDSIYALTILGQTASSREASGFSKGQIQENVRNDLLEADCRSIAETVNSAIISPLEKFLYGSEGTCSFRMNFEVPDNLKEKAEIVKILSESGFKADRNWIEKTFSVPLEKK